MESTVIIAERRRDPELRVVFDEIYARVESLYDTSSTWGGSALTTLAYRIVRESYPQLDALRVQSLVAALQRVHRERRARAVRAGHPATSEPA